MGKPGRIHADQRDGIEPEKKKDAGPHPPKGHDDDTSYETTSYESVTPETIIHYHQHTKMPDKNDPAHAWNIRLTNFKSEETLGQLKRTFFNVRVHTYLITERFVQFNFANKNDYHLAMRMYYTNATLESEHPMFEEEDVMMLDFYKPQQ